MGSPGVLHGSMSYLLQSGDGQIIEPHSVSAGLDYPGVGPEHSYLKEIGRAEYLAATDKEALAASSGSRASRGSSRRWRPPTPSRSCPKSAAPWTPPPGPPASSYLSGRGDKDVISASKHFDYM